MEVWKTIEGYEKYEVSNLGRIKCLDYRHTKKEQVLIYGLSKSGYKMINLYKNGIRKTRTIHSLVAEAFLNHKTCGHKLVINHINFDKLDNNIENLEIVTTRENTNQKHIKSSSKYTGVGFNKRINKWASFISINKKLKHLGYFDNEIEASEYYQNALICLKKGTEIKVKKPNFSSKHKGVCWSKKYNKWMAFIKINGVQKNLGLFKLEIDAYNARKEFKI